MSWRVPFFHGAKPQAADGSCRLRLRTVEFESALQNFNGLAILKYTEQRSDRRA